MEPIKLEEITPETLDAIAEQWEENRITDLIRSSVMKLGDELVELESYVANLEARCKIRALRLHEYHGLEKKKIAELFGVPTRRVTKWLK